MKQSKWCSQKEDPQKWAVKKLEFLNNGGETQRGFIWVVFPEDFSEALWMKLDSNFHKFCWDWLMIWVCQRLNKLVPHSVYVLLAQPE